MTTSRTIPSLSKPQDGEIIPLETLAYFRGRNRNRAHALVLEALVETGISQAEIARRLGKQPAVISRLIGAPGNWTLDTVSDLLLALDGREVKYTISCPFDAPARNHTEAEWLHPEPGRQSRDTTATTTSSSSTVDGARTPVPTSTTRLEKLQMSPA